MKIIQDFILKHPVIGTTCLLIPLIALIVFTLTFNPQLDSSEIRPYLRLVTIIYITIIAFILNGKNASRFFEFIRKTQLGDKTSKSKPSAYTKKSILREPTFIDIISILMIIPVFLIFYFLAEADCISIIYSISMPLIAYSIVGIIRKRIRLTYFVATGILSYIFSALMILASVCLILIQNKVNL